MGCYNAKNIGDNNEIKRRRNDNEDKLKVRRNDNEDKLNWNDVTYKSTKEINYNFDEGKVVKVVDGDTIWIAFKDGKVINRYKLRIARINAYELKDKNENKKRLANEGKQYLSDLILNKIVKVYLSKNRDKYGRLLGDVFIGDINVGEKMIEKGYAVKFMDNVNISINKPKESNIREIRDIN